jgi:hypothetical protein
MYRQRIWVWLLVLLSTLSAGVHSANAADEALVATFLAKRQALVGDAKVDLPEMSKAIRSAVAEGERLEREAKYQLALDRLADLQRYSPMLDIPSFDVHMLASWLYMKTGNTTMASAHRARADAMREVISNRIGTGQSPETPVHVVMASEVAEWARMQLARISDVKSQVHMGRELTAVTHSGPATGNKPTTAYFEFDARVQAQTNSRVSLFSPIPIDQMKPEHRLLFEQAKAKREAFLNDSQMPYLELVGRIRDAMAKVAQLDTQGKTEEAMSALKEIEAIRPIENIPFPGLIGVYSALNGKLGNSKKQSELRGLLFGINQAIAHSGDALTPQTAVHVIATEEEYSWLADKRLTMKLQKLVDMPFGKFDVLTTRNAAGEERDYYFNITRMFAKYGQTFGEANAK